MRIKTAAQAQAHLNRTNRFMMLTHTQEGSAYSLDNGAGVARSVAHQLQGDLFVKPSGDGLFPGFSQTWKVEG